MRQHLGLCAALGFMFSAGAFWADAQPEGGKKRPPLQEELPNTAPVDKGAAPKKKALDFGDPTEPAPPFQGLLVKPQAGGATVQRMPVIQLKGRVIGRGFSAALLEIDGKLQLVNKESSFSSGDGLTFRIEEVTATEVRIMALPQKQVMILH